MAAWALTAASPPLAHEFVNTSDFLSGNASVQILSDRAPHLKRFSLLRVSPKAPHAPDAPGPDETTLFFGLSGDCRVSADAPCAMLSSTQLRRGVAVLVRNGHKHFRWLKVLATLFDDTAPSARLVPLGAPAAT